MSIFTNVEELRNDLLDLLRNNPMNLRDLAKRIGIARGTLDSFMKFRRTPTTVNHIKIENYIHREKNASRN